MQVAIRNIGNSKGLVLSKPLLIQAGLDDQTSAQVTVENGAIVLRKPTKAVRVGWAQAAVSVANSAAISDESGDAALLMGDFGNADDEELTW